MFRTIALTALTVVMLDQTSFAQRRDVNYDESKVPQYVLPDPLLLEDGTSVADVETWQNKRRPELIELFRDQVYGHPPLERAKLTFKVVDRDDDALRGKCRRRQVELQLENSEVNTSTSPLKVMLLVYLPPDNGEHVPVFLGLNFQGNHTTQSDPAIRITPSWVRDNAAIGVNDHRASEEGRGAASKRWPIEYITSQGYGLVTAYYGDIDPDFDDGFENGIHGRFQSSKVDTKAAWGSIAGWAWGLSHIVDYLEQDSEIDSSRIVLMGHSRLGKTSLWAAAEDPRFAAVISNNSGCGGAALHRRQFGETVKIINTAFPHWFCDNFQNYNDRVSECPIDQHQLISLIAPRPVYVASAVEDRWADPKGEFLSARYASPVYRLYGFDGIEQTEMPSESSPLMSRIGYHVRPGKHDVTLYDWQQWIAFANKHLAKP